MHVSVTMQITFVLTLLVVVWTGYADRYYKGQQTVSWTHRQQFCGSTLSDLKWSICPNSHEDDYIRKLIINITEYLFN